MGEPAVLAPYGKVPAANGKVMWTGGMTIPALGSLGKLPEIIASDLCVRSRLCHLMYPRDKDPGCPAVFARHLGLVGNRLDALVCHLFSVIAVRAVFREDEPVAHERYWRSPGSLICCMTTF